MGKCSLYCQTFYMVKVGNFFTVLHSATYLSHKKHKTVHLTGRLFVQA